MLFSTNCEKADFRAISSAAIHENFRNKCNDVNLQATTWFLNLETLWNSCFLTVNSTLFFSYSKMINFPIRHNRAASQSLPPTKWTKSDICYLSTTKTLFILDSFTSGYHILIIEELTNYQLIFC